MRLYRRKSNHSTVACSTDPPNVRLVPTYRTRNQSPHREIMVAAFPEEDKLEYDVHEAHKAHERAQANLNVESQAAELLARAVTHMDRCYANVKEALSYSTYGKQAHNPSPCTHA